MPPEIVKLPLTSREGASVFIVRVPPVLLKAPFTTILELPVQVTAPFVPIVIPAVVQPVFDDAPIVTVAPVPVTFEAPVEVRSQVPIASVPAETVSESVVTLPVRVFMPVEFTTISSTVLPKKLIFAAPPESVIVPVPLVQPINPPVVCDTVTSFWKIKLGLFHAVFISND